MAAQAGQKQVQRVPFCTIANALRVGNSVTCWRAVASELRQSVYTVSDQLCLSSPCLSLYGGRRRRAAGHVAAGGPGEGQAPDCQRIRALTETTLE